MAVKSHVYIPCTRKAFPHGVPSGMQEGRTLQKKAAHTHCTENASPLSVTSDVCGDLTSTPTLPTHEGLIPKVSPLGSDEG